MSQVLGKAFNLITLVSQEVTTLSDFALAADMPQSTVHRLLKTLVDEKYLQFE